MIYYLYRILNHITRKQYIGITKNPKRRWYRHQTDKLNSYLSRAIQKYGKENFEFKILVIGDEAYIKELEVKAIGAFNTKAPNGYNLTDGGEGMTGYKPTVEHIDNIRLANLGHIVSLAARAKISAANSGRKRSFMTNEKIMQTQIGSKRSIKTRKKMSASQLGNTNGNKKLVISGKEYPSIRSASKNLGINYSTLRYKIKCGLL